MKTKQNSYVQMMAQIETLKKQADEVRRQEVKGVIAKIKEAIAAYGLTAEDLGFGKVAAPAKRAGAPARRGSVKRAAKSGDKAVRYRDDAGNTWVGLGKRPRWLVTALAAGRQLSDFAVK